MRVGTLVVALLLFSGCPRRRAELEAVTVWWEAQVEEKQHLVATVNDRLRAAELAEAELREALDGGTPAEVDAGTVTLAPPAQPPAMPEKGFFEGAEDTKLRVKIEMLQAESAQLDRMITDVARFEARKRRAVAQLKLLEAMRPDGG